MNFIKPLFVLMLLSMTSVYAQNVTHGPVKQNDTLWSIVEIYFDRYDLVMKDLVELFFENNPTAFVDNDINKLKTGVFLKLPKVKGKLKEKKRQKTETTELVNLTSPKSIVKTSRVILAPELKTLNTDESKKTKTKNSQIELAPKPLENASKTIQEESKNKKSTPQKAKSLKFNTAYNYELSSSIDDNMRLAQNDVDIRKDVVSNLKLGVSTNFSLTRLSRMSFAIAAELETYSTFDKLDNLKYSVESKYMFAKDTTFYAPIYLLSLTLGGIESESVMRTSNTLKLSANMNKRLTTLFHSTIGFQFRKRDSQSDVFDLQNAILFGNLDYSFDRTNILYGTYHYIVGDSVSSASPSLWIVNTAEAIEQDDAFGGVGINQFAYKIETTTQVITLGWNKRYSRALSFDVSAQFVDSEANDNNNIEYQRTILRAGILGKF